MIKYKKYNIFYKAFIKQRTPPDVIRHYPPRSPDFPLLPVIFNLGDMVAATIRFRKNVFMITQRIICGDYLFFC